MTEEEKRIQELNKQIKDLAEKLGRPVKVYDVENLSEAETYLRGLNALFNETDSSVKSLYSRLQGITSELAFQQSSQAKIRRSFRKITSIAEELKNVELDIVELDTKRLEKLQIQAKIEQQKIKDSSENLIKDNESLKLLDDTIKKKKEEGVQNDAILEFLRLELDTLGNIDEEQKAILLSYYDENDVLDDINKKLAQKLEFAKQIDSKTQYFGALSDLASSIPGLRKLSGPFKEAETAAKKAVKELGEGAKSSRQFFTGLGAGIKVLGKSIARALGPVTLIAGLVNTFINANKQAVDLARTLGTSVSTADEFRQRLREVRTLTGNTRNNVEFTIQATKELTEEFRIVGNLSDDILDSQTFLTRRVGATAQEASKLNLIFAATNQNAKESTKEMNKIVQEFANANGVAVPLKDVISDVSSAGSEIAGYFGFSTRELTQAVIRTRRLGVNLNQAKNIAEGLLNFESSISSELEAELLTGQQFNLERARMLAFTGDIAGATEDVLTQMQNLTEEQRKSPIIMKSMAAATGLSVEELNKAFLIQKNINLQRDEYNRIRYEEGEEAARIALRKAGVEQASIEDMERRITLSEQFQESMTDIKQQFMGLVNGGTIQLLIDSIQGFAEFMDRYFGPSMEERAERALTTVQSKGNQNINKDQILRLEKQKKEESDSIKQLIKISDSAGIPGLLSSAIFRFGLTRKEKEFNEKQINLFEEGKRVNTTNANDFTIRTNPKDTLVMAGGTQFGEETNTLLKELISAVKSGGDVYMDGNKVGQSLVLSTYKST